MIELRAEDPVFFWIPEGFAHGFAALEDNTVFQYKVTNYYHKKSERAILWNDPDLNIPWNINCPVVSEKDAENPSFKEFISLF
jgi:dTDP-4-dehydrorhamnose 3,5-epimerase